MYIFAHCSLAIRVFCIELKLSQSLMNLTNTTTKEKSMRSLRVDRRTSGWPPGGRAQYTGGAMLPLYWKDLTWRGVFE